MVSGFSPVFVAYAVFSILYMLIYVGHWRGRDLLTAISFVVVSDLTLLLASPGLNAPVMTGVNFLYVINILYAFAFFIEEMNVAFYMTLLSTLAVYVLVNHTSLSPHLIQSVQWRVPDGTRMLIFSITAGAFVIRLLVFFYEAASYFLEGRMSRSEAETFFANLDESICIIDRDMNLKRYNAAFISLYRRQYKEPPKERTNLRDIKLTQTRRQIYDTYIARAFAGEQCTTEIDFNFDGATFIYEISFCPILNTNGIVASIGLIYRDITARKRLEMDLVYTQNGLLEMIAHDLKSPLAMIKSINSLADEQDQYRRFIDKTCIQTMASIDNVLAFSRYLVTSDTSGYVDENVHRVLADKINEMDPNATIHGQQLYLDTADPELYVRMNRDAFGRAISNLINNSIKFTEGAGQICVRVVRDGDTHVQIKVSDQGIGIPEDIRAHLFDRFSKAGRNGLRGEQTVGLGLYIANVIVKLHGGSLTLDAQNTVGTTFVITLPLADRHIAG
jgi:PAS domain S-box-containing protein